MSRHAKAEKANDEYPEFDEEISLAVLLANAKSRGLGWTAGALHRNRLGRSTWVLDESVSCCAVGAWDMGGYPGGGEHHDHNHHAPVLPSAAANDDLSGCFEADDGPGSVQLGHAFRSAMCDEETAP